MRLGDYNLQVYKIKPGVIETDMTAGVFKKYQDLIENQNLCIQKRLGKGEDVVKAVAALVRGDFPYSSSQVFTVDGGLTIKRL